MNSDSQHVSNNAGVSINEEETCLFLTRKLTGRANSKDRRCSGDDSPSVFEHILDADVLLVDEEELQDELGAWSNACTEVGTEVCAHDGISKVQCNFKEFSGDCEQALPSAAPWIRTVENTCNDRRNTLEDQKQASSGVADVGDTQHLSNGIRRSSVSFNDLPHEVILKIFSWLRPRELCRFAAPVCIRWLQFSRDPSLWKCITHKEFKDVPDALFMQVLTSWCPLLKAVDFKCRTSLEDEDFRTIFSSCPLIEKISFAFCCQIDQNTLYLLRQNCKYVSHINLEGTKIKDASFLSLIDLPLEHINASHCTFLSDDGLIFLANNFSHLTGINFDGVQWITHDAVTVLVDKHGHHLQQIVLDGADLMDESVQVLSRCHNARTLHLSFCDSLTDESLKWIKKFCQVESLQLKKGMNFTNAGILDLLNELHFEHSANHYGLTYLNLAECSQLSDECLLCIADGCPNLKFLSLDWCWEVTDDGIDFIMDSCHCLVELCLCGLHELYGAPFARIPTETKSLRHLDLRQCNKVSDDFLVDIVQRMPSLTILNYYGDVVQGSLHFWTLDSKCSTELI